MNTPPPTWDHVAWLVNSGPDPSRSRASAEWMTHGELSTPESPRSRCRTTAATTSMATPAAIGDAKAERRRGGGAGRGRHRRGIRAVRIDRAYLWGLAANGQAGVENVLEIMRMGMGVASVHDLTPDRLVAPRLPPSSRRHRSGLGRGLGVGCPVLTCRTSSSTRPGAGRLPDRSSQFP